MLYHNISQMYCFHRVLQSTSPLCMQVLVVPPVLMVQREQQGWLERLERPELLEKLEPLVGFAVIRLQRRRFFLSSAVEGVEN